ncbi:MAG TPA: M28 family peptidase [Chitinophagaceae bacterium]|nr:M28 family peptidase [Chitinophagaceae bacterium]
MKNKFLLIACCILSVTVFAQNDNALKYASTITAQDLKKQLTIVASADMEGRETATPGQRKAAAYIEGQFKQLGLQYPSELKGYQQSYPLFKDTLVKSALKVGKNKYAFGKDYIVMPGTDLKNEIKSSQLVFVGYGIDDKSYSDYADKDVNGKVVVFFSGEPKINGKSLSAGLTRNEQWGTLRKLMVAKQKGASAILLISTIDTLSTMSVNNARLTTMYLPRPVKKENERQAYATVVSHVGKDILGAQRYNELSKKATVAEPLNAYNIVLNSKTKFEYRKKQIPFSSTNVVGYIEGTDKKDEYVFLTAHYDHLGKRDTVIFYGADDDGSGTVSVIEMAEAFAKAKAEGHGPRRTIVFMTVSGEEKGLWGSEYYTDHPIFPLEKTTVDLNTDMVGRSDPDRKAGDSNNYVYVVGDDKLSTDLKTISTGINKKYINMELDYKYNDPADRQRIYFRSDHYNFAKKGVPIIFYYDGMLRPDYHRPTDTVDKINFNLMEKRVRFIFLTAWEMANMDNMLKRDIPLPVM